MRTCNDSAIKIDPAYIQAYYDRASLLCELKRYEEALSTTDQILRVDPTQADAFVQRAMVYKRLGNETLVKRSFEEGLHTIKKNIQANTLHCEDLFDHPIILFELGREREAQDEIVKLERHGPESPIVTDGKNDCNPVKIAHQARGFIDLKKKSAELELISNSKDNKRMDLR